MTWLNPLPRVPLLNKKSISNEFLFREDPLHAFQVIALPQEELYTKKGVPHPLNHLFRLFCFYLFLFFLSNVDSKLTLSIHFTVMPLFAKFVEEFGVEIGGIKLRSIFGECRVDSLSQIFLTSNII